MSLRSTAGLGLGALVLSILAGTGPAAPAQSVDPAFLDNLEWRNIGPSRGGRAVAVVGVPGDPMTYYQGPTGGGVWKTTDAGQNWQPVTDGQLGTGSVGALAVADSDPNVVYVGMGECFPRGNWSHGDGVYRSVDAGRSWTHLGLKDSRHVGKILVHPDDPDHVYVAALGHICGPNETRGVYRSTDGGASWQRVHFVDVDTGCVDLCFDPSNPRILYAAFWQVRRTPWSLSSGGPGSALFKSTDGGDTWTELGGGLPRGIKGRIGVTVSPADPQRVWAIVEASDGGVYRSDDGGARFRRVSDSADLRQRAWYYTRIHADTQDRETVYVDNVRFLYSTDGGATWSTRRTPHGDHHDLWIAPEDNQRMISANDGGACISFNGGLSWSSIDNQATAQFYRVTVDDQHPYRVYGAQQDNSTVSISSRASAFRDAEFYSVGGGESGHIAVRPGDPNIVFAGSYGGFLTRYDHRTRRSRNIMVWPENPMGWGADALVERFQWQFPIVISPHDPDVLYVASQHLWRSNDEGQSWSRISPDLSTNDKSRQASSGGPITKDNTGVEYFCTIFSVAESPREPGVIWCGTDDGLVHVTRDGGETWTDVTPIDLPRWTQVNTIDLSQHADGRAWLACTGYEQNDYTPYVFRTDDYGASWRLLTAGIDRDDFVRSVREDPVKDGLVYAGTETGAWFSNDGGERWQSLQLGLPAVPITEMIVKDSDLVVATQGRSFWILDDLSALRQLDAETMARDAHLFTPRPTVRDRGAAVDLQFWLKEAPEGRAELEILDPQGETIRSYGGGRSGLDLDPGMNRFRWNLRYPDATSVPGAVLWGGRGTGPRAIPGTYTARLHLGERVLETAFEIRPDPNLETTAEEYQAQLALLLDIRDSVSEVHTAINQLRSVRSQVKAVVDRAKGVDGADEVGAAADAIVEALDAVEEELIQHRSKSSQDPLNYPIKLNNKMAALAGTISDDWGPTEQVHEVYAHLRGQIDVQLQSFRAVIDEKVPAFNELVRAKAVPAIVVEEDEDEEGGSGRRRVGF